MAFIGFCGKWALRIPRWKGKCGLRIEWKMGVADRMENAERGYILIV
jgi:hypothetical protein